MKKDIKKLIKEDFTNSYSVKYNKEELHNNFIVKEKEDQIVHTPKRKLILNYCLVALIGILMGVVVILFDDYLDSKNDVITEEFVRFLQEDGYKLKTRKEKYFISINNNLEIYIFQNKIKTQDDVEVKYYYFINIEKTIQSYLIINKEKIKLYDNCYGILTIIKESDPDQSLRFSIEVDGMIKEYILN